MIPGETAVPIIRYGGIIPWKRILNYIDKEVSHNHLHEQLPDYDTIYIALEPVPVFLRNRNNIVNRIVIGTNDLIIAEKDISYNELIEYIITKSFWIKTSNINKNILTNIYKYVLSKVKDNKTINDIKIILSKMNINDINSFLIENIKFIEKPILNLINIQGIKYNRYDYILLNPHRIMRGVLGHSDQETLAKCSQYVEQLIGDPRCFVVSAMIFDDEIFLPNIVFCHNSIYLFYYKIDKIIRKELFSSLIYLASR